MKKTWLSLGLIALLLFVLTGCGDKDSSTKVKEKSTANKTETIHYLGKDYKVPANPKKKIVIAGSVESLEDGLELGVKPAGALTVGGKFPELFKSITGQTTSIGDKQQPNMETVLKLKPDVILGTTKFPPAVSQKLTKIAPTIPVSNDATKWEDNLKLLAELTGKEDKANQIIEQYKSDLSAAKAKLGDRLKGKKVVAIRVRANQIMIYNKNYFFNPSLYTDLGLTVPDQINKVKLMSEAISLEKFSELNPDYLFVQFSTDENPDHDALKKLQNSPLWKSMNAVKNNHVFVNVVDPNAQGGTAWSKIHFLKAAEEKLSK